MSTPEPQEIKQLREKAQIELVELAKITSLSVPQLKQLEEGGDHLFYSPSIKQQAIKRVLKVIDPSRIDDSDKTGGEEFSHQVDPAKSISGQSKNVIEEIVRLSNKGGRAKNILPSPIYTKKNPSPMAWGAGLIFIGIVLMYFSPWDSKTEETSTVIISPSVNADAKGSPVIETVSPSTNLSQVVENTTDLQVSSETKSAIISSAKSTVDNSLNAVGSTLSTATNMMKSSTTVIASATLPSTPKDSKEVKTTKEETKPSQLAAAVASSQGSTNNTQTPVAGNVANKNNTSASDSVSPLAGVSPSAPANTPVATSAGVVDPCQLLGADAPVVMSSSPSKAGNYVYFTTADKASICVQDSAGKKTTVNISKDHSTSVYGKGPWQIASPDFSRLQIYFQGARVIAPENGGKRIQLVEQNISQ